MDIFSNFFFVFWIQGIAVNFRPSFPSLSSPVVLTSCNRLWWTRKSCPLWFFSPMFYYRPLHFFEIKQKKIYKLSYRKKCEQEISVCIPVLTCVLSLRYCYRLFHLDDFCKANNFRSEHFSLFLFLKKKIFFLKQVHVIHAAAGTKMLEWLWAECAFHSWGGRR